MAESEHDLPAEQHEARNEARQLAIDAGQRLWDSYGIVDNELEAAVVTGYVLIVEAVLPSGYTSVAWASGNGQPPGSEGITGLASHRVDGLIRHVGRELDNDRGCSE